MTTAFRDLPLPVRAAVTVRGDTIASRLRRDRAAGAAQSQRAIRFHDLGRAVRCEGGADQPGHPIQRRRGAARDDHRTCRVLAESAPSSAGARAHGSMLPRLERHDEGTVAGRSRQGRRARI